ncbi:amino acid ABC transporter permease [Corticicoccus populi]|uniref:Amino acid ABC transporter permease n=1 Tax=Corticicoccus populi TaxID=1812821 RepID=A0ABW5WXV4_9STAP
MELSLIFESLIQTLNAVPGTLLMAVIILFSSLILGAVIVYIQSLHIPVIHQILITLKSFIRGTPNVVLLFIMYYSFPFAAAWVLSFINIDINPYQMSPVIIVIITFTVCYSVFQSEILRGALKSLDYHQVEAAHSLGYDTFQTLRKVIIPQVLREALPDIVNTLLLIVKALSLAFLVTVVDIFAQARLTGAENFSYLESFFAAVLIYWILGGLITTFSNRIEKKLNRGQY